jgi:hypothetical protein
MILKKDDEKQKALSQETLFSHAFLRKVAVVKQIVKSGLLYTLPAEKLRAEKQRTTCRSSRTLFLWRNLELKNRGPHAEVVVHTFCRET